MNNKKGLPEKDVLEQCEEYLSLCNIYHWRQNTGAFKVESRYIRAGKPGISDILGILPGGRFMAVECKREKGGVLSADQRCFLSEIESRGGLALVVHSAEELAQGLVKNNIKNIL